MWAVCIAAKKLSVHFRSDRRRSQLQRHQSECANGCPALRINWVPNYTVLIKKVQGAFGAMAQGLKRLIGINRSIQACSRTLARMIDSPAQDGLNEAERCMQEVMSIIR